MSKFAVTESPNPVKRGGFINFVEKIGNKLPNPIYLFMGMSVLVIIISAFTANNEVLHPGTGETLTIKSLTSVEGFTWMLANIIPNFINFPPLGMVLVMMIGLGLAEETGLLRTSLRSIILKAPKTLVTFIVLFSGILGNIAGSATFVVIPPLGGLIFYALGRHPLAGIAAGFAGVASGLSANLLITPTDILLAGITEKAAHIIDPSLLVHPAVNWYFMVASTIVLAITGVFVTEKIVEPRLGKYNKDEADENDSEDEKLMTITTEERKGLRNAGLVALAVVGIVAAMVIPENGILRHPVDKTIVPSPFLSSMVPILLVFFIGTALAYGYTAKTIKSLNDIVSHLTNAMTKFSSFIVLCFFAAQFIEFFKYTNLGILIAVKGAEFLNSVQFVGIPLMLAFIVIVLFLNFFIGSSSAKWALLAPIFVPMFMEVGFTPAYTQAAYRIADSITNSISPLEPFMAFIIICAYRYNKNAGLGTVISIMIPYALCFLLAWAGLLVVWTLLGIPLGPGAVTGI